MKKCLCKEHGIRLFIIDYTTPYDSFVQEIQKQCQCLEGKLGDVDFDKEIDFSLAYIRDDRLIELRNLLKPKKIRLLSKKWLGTNENYKLECLVCGSIWEARGNAFFNRRRVAGCDYCNRRIPANIGCMQAVIDFANEHCGKVLSSIYVGRRANYEFECKLGHRFKRNFNNMKFRNKYCPICEGIEKETRKHSSKMTLTKRS